MSGLVTVCAAASFIGSLGINTHINYSDTPYANIEVVEHALDYLGISHIRDAPPAVDGSNLSLYISLVRNGIAFNFGIGSVRLSSFILEADRFVTRFPGSLSSIEGPNEVLQWPVPYRDRKAVPAAAALQKALYHAVKADALLARVPVYNFSFGGGGPMQYAQAGDLSAYVDYGNAHVYPQGGDNSPYSYLAASVPWQTSIVSPHRPTVVTETGYYTTPDQKYGVSETVQARYILDLVLDAVVQGIQTTYLYELFDQHADRGGTNMEDHFGLFRNNGSAKPAAVALHNLTTILAGQGNKVPSRGVVSYTLGHLPRQGHSLQLSKTNGTSDIVVWAEPAIWSQTTRTEVSADVYNMTVDLRAGHGSVSIYDPMIGTAPIAVKSDVSPVSIALTDHPIVIEVTAAP